MEASEPLTPLAETMGKRLSDAATLQYEGCTGASSENAAYSRPAAVGEHVAAGIANEQAGAAGAKGGTHTAACTREEVAQEKPTGFPPASCGLQGPANLPPHACISTAASQGPSSAAPGQPGTNQPGAPWGTPSPTPPPPAHDPAPCAAGRAADVLPLVRSVSSTPQPPRRSSSALAAASLGFEGREVGSGAGLPPVYVTPVRTGKRAGVQGSSGLKRDAAGAAVLGGGERGEAPPQGPASSSPRLGAPPEAGAPAQAEQHLGGHSSVDGGAGEAGGKLGATQRPMPPPRHLSSPSHKRQAYGAAVRPGRGLTAMAGAVTQAGANVCGSAASPRGHEAEPASSPTQHRSAAGTVPGGRPAGSTQMAWPWQLNSRSEAVGGSSHAPPGLLPGGAVLSEHLFEQQRRAAIQYMLSAASMGSAPRLDGPASDGAAAGPASSSLPLPGLGPPSAAPLTCSAPGSGGLGSITLDPLAAGAAPTHGLPLTGMPPHSTAGPTEARGGDRDQLVTWPPVAQRTATAAASQALPLLGGLQGLLDAAGDRLPPNPYAAARMAALMATMQRPALHSGTHPIAAQPPAKEGGVQLGVSGLATAAAAPAGATQSAAAAAAGASKQQQQQQGVPGSFQMEGSLAEEHPGRRSIAEVGMGVVEEPTSLDHRSW